MKRQNLRTVSLIVVTFTYLLIGAAIFGYLESEYEVRQRETLELIELIVKRKYNISDDDFTVLTTTVIKSVPHKAGIQWKFPGAFYFATTVVTTIGYGHSTPATMAGRSFCMIYALIGIPLGLVMFQSIGERLNTFVGFALKYTKRCVNARNPEVTQTNLVMVVSVLSTILMTSMAAVFAKYERWDYFDALYYCFITLTTIGFGDYVALQKESALQSKPEYVALSLIFILFGLSVVSSAVNLLVLKFLTLNTEDERRDEQLRYTANLNPIQLEGDVITSAAASNAHHYNQGDAMANVPNDEFDGDSKRTLSGPIMKHSSFHCKKESRVLVPFELRNLKGARFDEQVNSPNDKLEVARFAYQRNSSLSYSQDEVFHSSAQLELANDNETETETETETEPTDGEEEEELNDDYDDDDDDFEQDYEDDVEDQLKCRHQHNVCPHCYQPARYSRCHQHYQHRHHHHHKHNKRINPRRHRHRFIAPCYRDDSDSSMKHHHHHHHHHQQQTKNFQQVIISPATQPESSNSNRSSSSSIVSLSKIRNTSIGPKFSINFDNHSASKSLLQKENKQQLRSSCSCSRLIEPTSSINQAAACTTLCICSQCLLDKANNDARFLTNRDQKEEETNLSNIQQQNNFNSSTTLINQSENRLHLNSRQALSNSSNSLKTRKRLFSFEASDNLKTTTRSSSQSNQGVCLKVDDRRSLGSNETRKKIPKLVCKCCCTHAECIKHALGNKTIQPIQSSGREEEQEEQKTKRASLVSVENISELNSLRETVDSSAGADIRNQIFSIKINSVKSPNEGKEISKSD